MLKTTYTTNEVITLKLVSGEEIIGYYVKDDMASITLRKPLVPVPTDAGSVGLAPYIMSSDYLREAGGELGFSKNTIVTDTPTSKDFADAYVQQVSGLDVRHNNKPGLIT
jgi:hypothetical protein|tara:strand:- start:3617 stop:3946 length:330 start_codon:yes stop_codon:yes gene_type:complete